ncbi:FAD-dependent oxidoreductase [Brucella cytisi]|uniref:FAD-dependent oxidoreductase n=1 Tax=Brucella cytisi TaxID=407152 RepID=UPI000A05A9EE|nr:FAD-dependent oxidoreductase [Brucella cytisi]
MVDLAIVGAGPAGMAAALEVADAGFSVLVVDEQASAGGQIFRRPPTEWGIRHGNYRPYPWARDLIERFEDHPRIETIFRATAFGVLLDEPEAGSRKRLAVHTKKGGRLVAARRLLIATGAHDMPVAFLAGRCLVS